MNVPTLTVVDLVNDEAWFQNDDMGNHRIVIRVRVFGNIEVLLNDSSCIREKRPVGALRTFATMADCLRTYRSGGQQKVTVEHVTVQAGGQAIVGTVNRGVGGGDAQQNNG